MTKISYRAFSLIELSIVILIVGILVAGVTTSSRLIIRMRLQTAQSITVSSPVNTVKDLVFWFETTLEKSFNDSEEQNNAFLTAWYDNNAQSSLKYNVFTSASTASQPKYIENFFNGALPSVRFDGNDFFNIDGNIFVNTNFTIFVVERKNVAADLWIFHPLQACSTNECLHVGYRSDNNFSLAFYANDLDCNGSVSSSCSDLAGIKLRIHTMTFSKTAGKKYWLNGGVNPDAFDATQIASITTAKTGRIGGNYNGDLAELIVFNRALNDEERQAIESYLAKKYLLRIT
ncbi:hypothetical protein LBMAG18_00770 [Alphaproteobacteria bacterium]|nr:hypothetical protein LBMAG18_00770 [Alphaproteobacteria bacterium]